MPVKTPVFATSSPFSRCTSPVSGEEKKWPILHDFLLRTETSFIRYFLAAINHIMCGWADD